MTEARAQSVLERMARKPDSAPAEVPLTVSRAVRLSVTRAAEQSIGLALIATEVAKDSYELDGLLEQLNDELVMIGLRETEQDVVRGLMACSYDLTSAASEVQTFGEVSPDAADPRPVSSADIALLRPFLDEVLRELRVTTPQTALDGWADGVEVGDRIPRARAAGFALSDQLYRLVRVKLDLNGNGREGVMLVALPMAAQPAQAKIADAKTAQAWEPAFRAAVTAAPLRLNAVLHRFDMPLSVAAELTPGQVIPLRGATVSNVRLEDLDKGVVARGRLGQLAGNIAVRIEEPDRPHMQDLSDFAESEGGAPSLARPDMPALSGDMSAGLMDDPSPDLSAEFDAGALDLGEGAVELPMAALEDGPDLPDIAMAAPAGLELPTEEEEEGGLDLEGLAPMGMASAMDLSLDEDVG